MTIRDRLLLAIGEVHSGNREEGERIVEAVMPEIDRLHGLLGNIAMNTRDFDKLTILQMEFKLKIVHALTKEWAS